MMKVFEFIEVVAVFHAYMMHGNTGDAKTFAQKIGISRASLYNLIEELRAYGLEIEYDRYAQSYHYVYPERVEIHISIRQLPNDNVENYL